MSSPSGSPPNPVPRMANLVVRRKRASTIEPTPPFPLPADGDYTQERLLERVDYADARLSSKRRKPTPNTEHLLIIYKNACMDLHLKLATKGLSPDALTKHTAEIQRYDEAIRVKDWLRENFNSGLISDCIDLRRLTYWARYGDYAQHLASKLRKAAGENKTAFAAKISGSHLWTEISQKIKEESTDFREKGNTDVNLVPTTWAVYKACRKVGISFRPMCNIIHLYANRNAAFHRGLKEQIEARQYKDISENLFHDINDLASVVGPEFSVEHSEMQAVLVQLRDEWFDISGNPDDWQGWNTKQALKDEYAKLEKKKERSHDAAAAIADRAAKRLLHVDETLDLLMQASEPPDATKLLKGGPGSPQVTQAGKAAKRKASAPIDVDDRLEAWNSINNQQYGIYGDMQAILKRQRHVNRMKSAYRATYGEEAPPGKS